MKIELKHQYQSIATLLTEELPEFATLIGRNGAGKTQLLAALKEGAAAISGISVEEIELYDMVSFFTPNSGGANRQANQFARITADAYLLSPNGGQSPIQTAHAIFHQVVTDIERNSGVQARDEFEQSLRDEVGQVPDFSVFAAQDKRSPYKETLYQQVMAPLIPQTRGRANQPSNQPNSSFNGNQAALITAAMKLTKKLPHELTRDDIMRASHYEGNTLANSVSAVFAAYKVDQYTWSHERIETECIPFDELIAEYRTKYRPPWETLREIMSEMREASGDDGLFDFEFSDPENFTLNMTNYERFTFRAEMMNRTTGAHYELDSLSSGEKVLMALCIASFNQYLGRRTPKLLLLDELDAMLHPSMVAALVRTLKTLFVSQGAKVLLTSHSPMTVAALDETDIFHVVRTGGDVKVFHTTRSQAIGELSEGLATVDVGLRIAAHDDAKVTILTEGNNVKHLKRWIELNFQKDVRVFEGLERHTNNDQLLAYGRLLAKMNTNTHFVIVWDCDSVGKAEALCQELPSGAKITPYAFQKREDHTIVERGIENNYDDAILEPYATTTRDSDGTLLGRGITSKRKREFANHVAEHGTPEYFTNYRDLRDIVHGILESFETT